MNAAQGFHVLGAMALCAVILMACIFTLGGIARLITCTYRTFFPSKTNPKDTQ